MQYFFNCRSRPLEYNSPDKALESSYDSWALSGNPKNHQRFFVKKYQYLNKALIKLLGKKIFVDLSQKDIDKMPTLVECIGTVWQYRWFCSFDVLGLKT
jgi:hypothetical protein